MNNKPIEKQFLKYVLPSMFSQLLASLYTIVDGLFIGVFIGDIGLGAINLAWPLAALVMATGIGIGTGGAVIVSNKMGANDKAQSLAARANAIIYMVIACVVLTVGMYFLIEPALLMFGATGEVFTAAKEYSQLIVLGCSIQIFASGIFPILRNCEKAMPVMFITVLGLVSNIILDAVFIYKLNWGIKGAAAATLLAQGISLSIGLVLLVTDKKRPFKKAQFKLQKNIFMEITRIGISPFALFITPSVTLLLTNAIAIKIGGQTALATYAVSSYLCGAVSALLSGIGDGIQPLVSFATGAGNKKAASSVLAKGVVMALAVSLCVAVTAIFARNILPNIYGCSDAVKEIVPTAIVLTAVAFPFMAMVKLLASYLYACNHSKLSAVLVCSEPLFFSPILLLTLPRVMNLTGLWLTFPLALMAATVLGLVLLKMSRKKQIG